MTAPSLRVIPGLVPPFHCGIGNPRIHAFCLPASGLLNLPKQRIEAIEAPIVSSCPLFGFRISFHELILKDFPMPALIGANALNETFLL